MTDAGRTPGGIMANITELRRRITAHNIVVASAGIAFYGILALVPTLIALVSIYGLVTEPEQIADQVEEYAGSLDESTQKLISDQLNDIIGADTSADEETEDDGIAGTAARIGGLAFGIGLALFASSGAVQKLIATVAVAYEAPDGRPGWLQRLLAYGFTTGAIVGVAAIGFTLGVLPAILDRVDIGAAESVIGILQLPVLAVVFALGLTILYRYGPDRRPRTPWRNPGALVGTLLFVFFAIALSIYTSRVGDMPASYGVLGSIAVLMIFLQLTALAVIIGAEVNGAIEVGAVADPTPARAGSTPGSTAALVPAGAVATATPGGGGQGADGGGNRVLGFGKALAGLVVLAVLGRAGRDED
ncbi:MAG: YihY/virulence factor BrkB family protein [Actinomycetota bacterium]